MGVRLNYLKYTAEKTYNTVHRTGIPRSIGKGEIGSPNPVYGSLIRRIKTQAKNHVNCIGTSATIVSGGTIDAQKEKIAEVASKIFGSKFNKKQIINESLVRCFNFDGLIPSDYSND